jgi:ubiquinone/menaquinone biosynthesis C-methylase UbiE
MLGKCMARSCGPFPLGDPMSDGKFDPSTHYQNPAIAEGYDDYRFTSLASKYGHWKEVAALARVLDRIPGARTALDTPCGTGRITKVLLDRGLDVTGADISPQMMGEARKKLECYGDRVSFVEADLRSLQFADSSFDMVTCVRLFGHVPSEVRTQMLREMRRVTRRWVVVNYFYLTPLIQAKRWFKRRVLHTYEGVIHPCSKSAMLREVAEAGLEVEVLSFARRYYSEEVYALLSRDA